MEIGAAGMEPWPLLVARDIPVVLLKGADVAHRERLHVSDRPVFTQLVRGFANAVLAPANEAGPEKAAPTNHA